MPPEESREDRAQEAERKANAALNVAFAPSPGSAEGEQMTGQAQGAEVIGAALLYVHQAPDAELAKIEDCLDQGVTG